MADQERVTRATGILSSGRVIEMYVNWDRKHRLGPGHGPGGGYHIYGPLLSTSDPHSIIEIGEADDLYATFRREVNANA